MTHLDHSGKVLFMRVFITVLFLIFSVQSWTKADDIRDFQIEGMSIGDSLLDYFTKNVIENEKYFEKEQGNNKEVARFYIREKKGNYDWIAMSFKTSDNNYSLIELSGFIFISPNIALPPLFKTSLVQTKPILPEAPVIKTILSFKVIFSFYQTLSEH